MMKERYNVDVVFGPAETNSRPALIGDKYAAAQGEEVGQAYHRAVLRAYWEEGRDIANLDELKAIAESVGLDGKAFLAALNDVGYEEEVDADVEQAARYNMTGVPALVFGGRYLVMGAQRNEVFAQVMERVEAERAS
jgi:predicted DsbA family dithiol-disulfide isomerase